MKTKTGILLGGILGTIALTLSTTIPLVACSSNKIDKGETPNNSFTTINQTQANTIASKIITKTQTEATSIDNLKSEITTYFGSDKVSNINITSVSAIGSNITVSSIVVNFNNSVNFNNQSFSITSPVAGQLTVNGSTLTFTPDNAIETSILNGKINFDINISKESIEYNQNLAIVSVNNITSTNSSINSYKYEWYVKQLNQPTFTLMPDQNTNTLTLQANDENIVNNSYKVKVIAANDSSIFVEKEIPSLVGSINITYDLSTQQFSGDALNIPSCVTELKRTNYESDYIKNNTPTSLNFGDNSHLKIIGEYAFYSFQNLSGEIIVPNTVTTISNYAFDWCSKISNLILNEGLQTIGKCAFRACGGLGNLIIPSTVTSIGSYAFTQSGLAGTITIPSSVISIENNAFGGCHSITGIVFDEGLQTIGNYAFASCSQLNGSVTIPSTVTSIGSSPFNCTKLSLESITNNSKTEPINGKWK